MTVSTLIRKIWEKLNYLNDLTRLKADIRNRTINAEDVIVEIINKGRDEFFTKAVGYLLSAFVKGDYHEYGCFSATSFRMMLTEAYRFQLDWMKFFAFDSFMGLPEIPSDVSEHHNWEKGSMYFSEEEFWKLIREHGIWQERIKVIKGFYDQSLTPKLQQEFIEKENKIAIVNIDCDLYESAVPVFRFIEPLIQEGTLIYLDDFYAGYKGSPKKGVARAFFDFTEWSAFKFQPYLNVGFWGKSFIAYKE